MITGYVAVMLDVTEAKEAELQLAEREHQLMIFTDNVSDAICRIGLDARYRMATPSALDILGASPDTLKDRYLFERVHSEEERTLGEQWRALARGELDKTLLVYRSRRYEEGGVFRWLETSCSLVRDTAGEPKEIVASIRDVSDRKALEAELETARHNAEEAARVASEAAEAKSRFLANMSHEIHTPMNGVIGFTNLMLQGELSDEQRARAQRIAESGRTMLQLLNDILDLSRIEAGQIMISADQFDPARVIAEAAALFESAAEAKQVKLTIKTDPGLPAAIQGDSLRVRQIISNLVGNAVKFTAEGKIVVQAEIVAGDAPELCVNVKDSGPGISTNRLESIFGEFVQEDDSIARNFGGSGLGLAISRWLAEAMGGTLSAESVVGLGSIFRLRLPMVAVDGTGNGTTMRGTPSGEALRPLRILVAEDYDVNQELIRDMLARLNATVVVVGNGAKAVQAVNDDPSGFDLVLMDMQMPEMDGLTACRALPAAGHSAEALPVVALTANAYPEDIAHCSAAGMQQHLAKPIDMQALRDCLLRWARPASSGAEQAGEDWPAELIARLRPQFDQLRAEIADALDRLGPVSEVEGEVPPEAQRIVGLCHKLSGTAKIFGEHALGGAARAFEAAVDNNPAELQQAIASLARNLAA